MPEPMMDNTIVAPCNKVYHDSDCHTIIIIFTAYCRFSCAASMDRSCISARPADFASGTDSRVGRATLAVVGLGQLRS